MELTLRGRALFRSWGLSRPTNPMQTPNTEKLYHGRHTVGDKVHRGKGKSPDHPLRSQNHD